MAINAGNLVSSGLDAVPGIGGTLSGAFDVGNSLVGGFFGGGSESGHGRAKRNTLAWYIDKLKGVNDNEAIDVIAPALVRMKQNGASKSQLLSYLKSHSNEGTLGPEEYNPILSSLNSYISRNQKSSYAGLGSGSGSSSITSSPLFLILIALLGYKFLA